MRQFEVNQEEIENLAAPISAPDQPSASLGDTATIPKIPEITEP
ncbi:MAG: hypothetical protein K0Q54_299 [Methylobacterium brachiatum]|jgi:hypothetical protein|nr:hypothetical protein [Methylobacterium brachiatum]